MNFSLHARTWANMATSAAVRKPESGLPSLRCNLWRTTGERGGAEHRRLPSLYMCRCHLKVLGCLFCGDLLSGWCLDGGKFPDRRHKDLQVFCAKVPGHVYI
ncbi:hypothetical protein ACQJBY_027117 [Aegilops geniculata]